MNWIMRARRVAGPHNRQPALVAESPLRGLDPRAKMAMSLAVSLLVMLPLERLAPALAGYVVLLAWARLLPAAGRQVWRLRWLLLVLFAADWWLIDFHLAVLVSLRLVLLAGSFSLLFSTTSFGEFRLAIECMGVPYHLAFSLGLAFQSLNLLEEEWQATREAQQSRGIFPTGGGLRQTLGRIGDWVALTVPAVVLATRRAWAMTEAAYARGFDSPLRQPYRQISLRLLDWLVIGISLCIPIVLYWRWG